MFWGLKLINNICGFPFSDIQYRHWWIRNISSQIWRSQDALKRNAIRNISCVCRYFPISHFTYFPKQIWELDLDFNKYKRYNLYSEQWQESSGKVAFKVQNDSK